MSDKEKKAEVTADSKAEAPKAKAPAKKAAVKAVAKKTVAKKKEVEPTTGIEGFDWGGLFGKLFGSDDDDSNTPYNSGGGF